jgi:hypothetical protein
VTMVVVVMIMMVVLKWLSCAVYLTSKQSDKH